LVCCLASMVPAGLIPGMGAMLAAGFGARVLPGPREDNPSPLSGARGFEIPGPRRFFIGIIKIIIPGISR
jgi:hypothetical protein